MNLQRWDRLEGQIAELLLNDETGLSQAIGSVARDNPEDSLADLMLACLSICANFNQNLCADHTANIALHEKYEVVASLSADLAALSGQNRTCAVLVGHWSKTGDVLFI